MKLFGHDRVFGIGPQLRCWKIMQQHWVADRLRRWRNRVPEPDVNLQRDARTIQRCLNVDSDSSIACLFSDDRPLD